MQRELRGVSPGACYNQRQHRDRFRPSKHCPTEQRAFDHQRRSRWQLRVYGEQSLQDVEGSHR